MKPKQNPTRYSCYACPKDAVFVIIRGASVGGRTAIYFGCNLTAVYFSFYGRYSDPFQNEVIPAMDDIVATCVYNTTNTVEDIHFGNDTSPYCLREITKRGWKCIDIPERDGVYSKLALFIALIICMIKQIK